METAETKNDTGHPIRPSGPCGRGLAGFVFDAGALFILAAVSLLAGCLINLLRANPLPWIYKNRAQTMTSAVAQVTAASPVPVAADDPGEPTHEIRVEEFQSFVTNRKGLVLDARPAVFYREAHVPGAISLPREAFAEEYPHVRATLESFRSKPIVVYCTGADCPDSQLLTDALTNLGYRHLLIYTSGWEEWSQTGLPQEP